MDCGRRGRCPSVRPDPSSGARPVGQHARILCISAQYVLSYEQQLNREEVVSINDILQAIREIVVILIGIVTAVTVIRKDIRETRKDRKEPEKPPEL